MTIALTDYVLDQAGNAKNGLTIEAWHHDGVSAASSTTTDSNGLWSFASLDATKTWRIKVIDGTKAIWRDARAKVQLTSIDLITALSVDTISEHTAASGVTIDGVLLKDGGVTVTAATNVADDILFTLGTDSDGVLLNKSLSLNANTAWTDVLIGTPVSRAIAANTLMIANKTATGDLALYVNQAGASWMGFFMDSSAGDTSLLVPTGGSIDHWIAGTKVLDHASGAFAFQESTTISSTGTLTINAFTLGGSITGATNTMTGMGSINGLVITANTGAITTGSWTATVISPVYGGTGVANNVASTLTISGAYALTLTLSNTTSVTLPTTGTLATLAGAETFTGKVSYNGLVVTANTGAITTGTWTATAVGAAYGGTGVANNAASTLTISGNFATTLTVSAITSVTLPTTGTLATLAGTEELDNKTLDSSVGKGAWTASGTWTLPAFTLGGAVAGGDQAFTNVGDMTFAAGSILASGTVNGNTLLMRANDTTFITFTTGATDAMEIANATMSGTWLASGTVTMPALTLGGTVTLLNGTTLANPTDKVVHLDFSSITGSGGDASIRITTDRNEDSSGLWLSLSRSPVITGGNGTADSGTTTTMVDAALTQTDDYWNYAILKIITTTDGLAPQGEVTQITDFDAATDTLTFGALTAVVDAGDTYEIYTGDRSASWSFGQNLGSVAETSLSFSDASQQGNGGGAVVPSANARFTISETLQVVRWREAGWGFGAEPTTGSNFCVVPAAYTAVAATNTYAARFAPSGITIPAGTTAIAATAAFFEPVLTATGTITRATTVYIANAPTEGATANHALWVDTGSVQFDGALNVDGDTVLAADLYMSTTAKAIKAPNGDNLYMLFHARDNGVGLVEVGRIAGAADPYISFGSTQQFKFYNSGVADLGNVTFAASATIDGTASSSITFNNAAADVDFTFKGDNNATLLVLDGGADTIGVGAAVAANAFLNIGGSITAASGGAHVSRIAGTATGAANNDVLAALTMTSTAFAKGTLTGLTAIGLRILGANFTASGTGTIDNAYGIYVASAPTIGAANYGARIAGYTASDGGVMIGALSTNNLIDDASNGAASTTLYIGNQSILVSNGVNFGPAAVASITVVNGQITAIS